MTLRDVLRVLQKKNLISSSLEDFYLSVSGTKGLCDEDVPLSSLGIDSFTVLTLRMRIFGGAKGQTNTAPTRWSTRTASKPQHIPQVIRLCLVDGSC